MKKDDRLNDRSQAAESGFRAFLAGFGRDNRAGLAAIAAYDQWPVLASTALSDRMASILESFKLEELAAIAREEIDLGKVAHDLLAEFDKE